MGIEPTTRLVGASLVLKTRGATRLQSPPYLCKLLSGMVESNIVATVRSRARILSKLTKIAVAHGHPLRVEILENRDNILASCLEDLSRLSRPELRRKREGRVKVASGLAKRVDMKNQELFECMIHERHRAARGNQQLNEVVTCAGIWIGLCAKIFGVRRLQTSLAQRLFNRAQLGALRMREPGKRIMPGERDPFPSTHHAALFDK